MIKWIVFKWDMLVYRLSHRSIRRICDQFPGMAYFMLLQMQDYCEANPIPESLRSTTKHFHEAIKSIVENRNISSQKPSGKPVDGKGGPVT